MPTLYNTTAYRYPNERLILAATFLLVFLVIALTATATVCLSLFFVLGILGLSYHFTRSHHQDLLRAAHLVTTTTQPALSKLADEAAHSLQVEPVQVFVAHSRALNAYTFGLTSPKVVVLHSALFKVMDPAEILFILGHEMGHVRLGHTWLNSLVGGMAGIPSSFVASALLEVAFYSWNRTCEYSADRAGLLACRNPHKAISALVKLETGAAGLDPAQLERALQAIEQREDHWLRDLGELHATHPNTVRRIRELRKFAASDQYRYLQGLINHNLTMLKGPQKVDLSGQ
jgi:Zn-dependent protease with chaperone function